MSGYKGSKASLAEIWLLFGQGQKFIKSLKWAKLPKSVQNDSLLGSNVHDNLIDVNDDNDDTILMTMVPMPMPIVPGTDAI